jgi:aminopeptidase N
MILFKKIIVFLLLLIPEFLAARQAMDHNDRSLISFNERHVFLPREDGIRADNSRSDSIDILDYNIHLNITDFINKKISGFCTVTFKSKLDNIPQLYLDLLKLNIDSVTQNGQLLSFSYSDSVLLIVDLLTALNTGDSSAVNVFYHGTPQQDASGWGGFYFSTDYAYNLGVGFAADPHVYGRVWFPCFDNFVERSTYHFSITTVNTKMALCNGELISGIDNGDGTKTWNWKLDQTIPTYLACVAIGSYSPAYFNYYGIADTIPVQLGAVASDTVNMKNSFIHLTDALFTYENAFGPYRWNKVGYSLIPFTGGAMEHATNIGYPQFMANGNTDWENFYAHELSHHWFGDLVTCETAEDMWLNEGWAVYCEYLFFEHVYGKEKYDEQVAANHAYVVHLVHTPLGDGQYFPVSGVPQDYTYGRTVYDKGADVVHTLRSYMGDSLFFHCVTNYLTDRQFSAANSYNLRDDLSSCSGIDLTDFFDDWIFARGFAQFSIDSMQVAPAGGQYSVNVYIKQRLDHAPHYYNHVPLEITFMNDQWEEITLTTVMNGRCGIFSAMLPFNPVYAGLDLQEKISDAVTADTKTITGTGSVTFVNGAMTLTISSLSDSAFLRIEHNYAPPDGFKTSVSNLHISDYHYWKVDGIFPMTFDAASLIHYDGTTSGSGYLDNTLITNSEDSLVVLYRASPRYDWTIQTDVTQNFLGTHNDKRGLFTINHLQKGEYALGIFDHNKIDSVDQNAGDPCNFLSVPPANEKEEGSLLVFPNPADQTVTVSIDSDGWNNFEIYNLYGQRMYSENLPPSAEKRTLSVRNWPRGTYLLRLSGMETRKTINSILIIN